MVRLNRLFGRKVADRVRRKGKVLRGKHMSITYFIPPVVSSDKRKPGIFAGSSASTKLHKSAVKRNRMRRRCREALRITLLQITHYPLPASIQLLISPRSSSLTCDFGELLHDADAFLKHVKICH